MADWDKGGVYYSDVFGNVDASGSKPDAQNSLERRFLHFLELFRIDDNFIYREQLRRNLLLRQYYLVVDLPHLLLFDELLAVNIQTKPAEMIPLMESAARTLAQELSISITRDTFSLDQGSSLSIQIQISSSADPLPMRLMDSTKISKLVRITGIVVSTSSPVSKPSEVFVVCRACSSGKSIPVNSSFGGVNLPRTCLSVLTDAPIKSKCPIDPYVILSDKCVCVDQQTIKLQEAPDLVPVGELPRHILLTAQRYLVNKVSPGSRVTVNGVFSIFQNKNSSANGVAIRSPYVKVLGIEVDSQGTSHSAKFSFTEEQESRFLAFSKQPRLYERIAKSINPSIFGNDDIKMALACLLFGGSRKSLPDGLRLRGDVNVLLLGDPGTAKSQFLKFIEKVAPISVYTSGKGSSAAGLTASVIRDPSSGEFYLEGGAMVLADGGVVCIDEFDKMRDEDRVAIHEAMEQQTISIAKAGITTILNSRTAVLAAANPIFGRYDELKSPGENIDFSTTILSRFDMIFIVKDEHSHQRDISLARHVLSVHMNPDLILDAENDISISFLKNYVSFCKSRCAPRLSHQAANKLSDHYVLMRSEIHSMEMNSVERSSIPITVRQLEAIIRISESIAKMTLSPIVLEEHVDEALRLFKVSTMHAVQSGHSLEGSIRPDLLKEVEKIERAIKARVPIGSTVNYPQLIREFVHNKGFHEHAVVRAIDIMVQQEKLVFRNQRKVLLRQP